MAFRCPDAAGGVHEALRSYNRLQSLLRQEKQTQRKEESVQHGAVLPEVRNRNPAVILTSFSALSFPLVSSPFRRALLSVSQAPSWLVVVFIRSPCLQLVDGRVVRVQPQL